MLTQVDVVYENEQGYQALALPIFGITPKESLLIHSITGLNPPDVDLFIGDYARDGGIYQGRRVGKRNVVMTIDLNPNPALGQTVSSLRDDLYRVFMDPLVEAEHLQFILHDDDAPTRYLVGYTEKFETELFSAEAMIQTSIICPDPYIKDLAEVVHTPPDGSLGWTTVPFTYTGSAEAGFIVEINFLEGSSMMTLSNNGRTMVVTYPFTTGDKVIIDTNRGQRDVRLIRSGVTIPLIAKLSPASRWLELHSKTNAMKIYGTDTTDLPAVITSLRYVPTYWGV